MQTIGEGRDNTEVAAASADGPKEVCVLVGASRQQPAIRSHDVGGQHVVAGEPVFAVEPADATSEGQTGDAGNRHDSERRGQAVRLGGDVKVGQERTRSSQGDAPFGVDLNVLHAGAIQHEPAGADGVPCHVVAAALDGDREIIFPGEVHGKANILGVGGTDNDVRTAVNHRIED